MRGKKFVRRAGEKIAIQRPHIDRPVGNKVHGIHEHQRADRVGQPGNLAYIVDRPDSV